MDSENPEKKETVIINGEEHNVADLTQQVTLINHVSDLDRKASQINFSLEQTLGARNHFMGLLNQSLEEKEDTVDKAVND